MLHSVEPGSQHTFMSFILLLQSFTHFIMNHLQWQAETISLMILFLCMQCSRMGKMFIIFFKLDTIKSSIRVQVLLLCFMQGHIYCGGGQIGLYPPDCLLFSSICV